MGGVECQAGKPNKFFLRAVAPILKLERHRAHSVHWQQEDLRGVERGLGYKAGNSTQLTLSATLPKCWVDLGHIFGICLEFRNVAVIINLASEPRLLI